MVLGEYIGVFILEMAEVFLRSNNRWTRVMESGTMSKVSKATEGSKIVTIILEASLEVYKGVKEGVHTSEGS